MGNFWKRESLRTLQFFVRRQCHSIIISFISLKKSRNPATRGTRCDCPRSDPSRGSRALTVRSRDSRPTSDTQFRPTLTRAQEKCDGGETRARDHVPFGSANPEPPEHCWVHSFPSDGFTYFLTLFSKFFSSFPHGTCSLSVSRRYLALDGVYHPFWAAFPNNPTLRKHIVGGRPCHRRGCHPLRRAVPSNLGRAPPPRKCFSQLQLADAGIGDFKFELFPLHSPLLRESLLVSFPPLINMLKFSG